MDPRHPEEAIKRIKDLIKQYDRVEKDMKKATTSAALAQLEREGSLVVQEICMVAPRIHEAMMQTSRQRRHELSRGVVEKPVEKFVPKPGMMDEATADKILDAIEKVAPASKKKTTKKKTTGKKGE